MPRKRICSFWSVSYELVVLRSNHLDRWIWRDPSTCPNQRDPTSSSSSLDRIYRIPDPCTVTRRRWSWTCHKNHRKKKMQSFTLICHPQDVRGELNGYLRVAIGCLVLHLTREIPGIPALWHNDITEVGLWKYYCRVCSVRSPEICLPLSIHRAA